MGNGRKRQPSIQPDAVIFDLILLCFFVLLALLSFGYNPRARSIPLGLGILGSLMAFMQLLVDVLPSVRAKLRFVSATGLLSKESRPRATGSRGPNSAGIKVSGQTQPASVGEGVSIAGKWWRVSRVVMWLVAFIILLALTNYLIAVGAFIVLVTRFEAKESWKKSILLGACTDLGFFILFELLLKVQL